MRSTILSAFLFVASLVSAEWTDVTKAYLVNPTFAETCDGWEVTNSYTVRAGCIEWWNQWSFRAQQTLHNLPQGHYRLSVNGFHRLGGPVAAWNTLQQNGDSAKAFLFANGQQHLLANYFERGFEWTSTSSWYTMNGNNYPNTMETAAEAFAQGAYVTSVEFDSDGGDVPVGVEYNYSNYDYGQYVGENWGIFTNFKLEFSGTVVLVRGLSLTVPRSEMAVGETMQIVAKVTPDNALIKALEWKSTNTKVATVDANGVVTAYAAGSTVIYVSTTDGSNISKAVSIKVVNRHMTSSSFAINEIMVANVDEFISPAFNFDGWIELYNKTDEIQSLKGVYLSDDAQNLKKWAMPASAGVLPANGYKVIWFDSNNIAEANAPFKLDVDGGTIYISNGSGDLLLSQTYPAAIERASYARKTDGDGDWSYCSTPTLEASNATASFATQQLSEPVVDQPSQLFTTKLSVNVTIPSGQKLRYTIDGTLPTLTNGITASTGQFTVSETKIFRFRLFADGKLPSRVVSRSYIYKGSNYYLPVVSVVTDPDFIWSSEIGVFEKGPNGRPGNGQRDNCNWNMDWERPVNFSYLDADGEMVLNQDVDLEMCGGWSRAWTPHSFKLKGNKEYGGNKNLPYAFFEQKPYIRNRTLQVRNGGNDNSGRMKDPALQYLVQSSGLNLDCQSYQPVHEFINGRYMGVLNVREPNNKHYVYANYGWDDDEIDQFEMSPDSGYVQKCGTPDAFNELVDVLSPAAANSDTYDEICKVLDIDSYVNYMATELYLGSTDWPQNNVKAFRHIDGGKFRFVLFDLDGAFGTNNPFGTFMGKENYTFDQLYPVSLGRIKDRIRLVTLFKNMLKSATFRRKFIDAYCMIGGSVFEAKRVTEIVNYLEDRVSSAMQIEGGQWSLSNSASSVRNSLSGRLETSNSALASYSSFGLSTPQRVQLSSDVEGAKLLVNNMEVPTGSFNGYLYAPVVLKAEAPAGYVFQGWTKSGSVGTSSLKAMGTQWSYYDQGSLDGKNWTSPTYSESGWKKGNAPLGYGKDNVATTISYGSDAQNKRPTSYFRTTVTLQSAPGANDVFTMDYMIDDAAVIYVNGQEAARYNISASNVTYNTFADHYAYNNPDAGSLQLPASMFHKGDNVIAVEVHNCDNHSTDLLWDASIYTSMNNDTPTYYSTDQEIALPSDGNIVLKANFRELTQQERKQQGFNPVCINEVSGSNNSFINEYGKKNDWVELYNTTDSPVDIEGMYLSDNLSKADKYKITKGNTNASTVIPAHGYLLIWCDKLATTDAALHASFKVSGEGGVLTLMAADKSWKDELYYRAHDANTTIGRYPDGCADVYEMSLATIANSNILTSYVVKTDQEELKKLTGVEQPMIASANGFRIRYGADQLLVKNEGNSDYVTVDVYTSDGRLVESQVVAFHQGVARMSVAHLPSGFYVARATDSQQGKVGCKFMK